MHLNEETKHPPWRSQFQKRKGHVGTTCHFSGKAGKCTEPWSRVSACSSKTQSSAKRGTSVTELWLGVQLLSRDSWATHTDNFRANMNQLKAQFSPSPSSPPSTSKSSATAKDKLSKIEDIVLNSLFLLTCYIKAVQHNSAQLDDSDNQ